MKWDHTFIRLVKQASISRYVLGEEYNKLGRHAFSTSITGGLNASEKQDGCGKDLMNQTLRNGPHISQR